MAYMVHVVLISAISFIGPALSASPNEAWSKNPAVPMTQYHTQDSGSGAYQYGYTGPQHTKTETSFNGVTRGGYSYIDANGVLQRVSYTADRANGFRVQGTNLPEQPRVELRDTPDVAFAKRRHFEERRRAEERSSSGSIYWQNPSETSSGRNWQNNPYRPQTGSGVQPPSRFLVTPQAPAEVARPNPNSLFDGSKDARRILNFPVRQVALPAAYVLPVYPYPKFLHSSMRHTQDSMGQYEYSYTGDTSAKTEKRSLDGTTTGSYSYIDANGILQQVHYIADSNGFRVLATNLPEAK